MRKYEVSEEVIKELHLESAPHLRSLIEKEVPELFQKFENSKWYKLLGYDCVIFKTDKESGYGLNHVGEWTESDNWTFQTNPEDWRLATEAEVTEALINEAKKRGIVSGNKVKGLGTFSGILTGNTCIANISGYYFSIKNNELWVNVGENENALVFDKGKWATVIDQPKEMTMAELEKHFGSKIKIVSE